MKRFVPKGDTEKASLRETAVCLLPAVNNDQALTLLDFAMRRPKESLSRIAPGPVEVTSSCERSVLLKSSRGTGMNLLLWGATGKG